MISLREESSSDKEPIRSVNLKAFPTSAEADLVDELRRSVSELISLVAEKSGEIVGHILFTPVSYGATHMDARVAGLAPMSVLPSHQNEGIGTALVKEGLAVCKAKGYDAVVVLGHTWFYPKFGFTPAIEYGVTCDFEVPSEVFMLKLLRPEALNNLKGKVYYHDSFHNE